MKNFRLAFRLFISLILIASSLNLAQAATINVTANAADVLNGADNSCALREAITNINNGMATFADCPNMGAAFGMGDTINLPAGTYTNTIASTNEDFNANGDLDILRSVAIVGAGAAATFIDGGMVMDRVFHVAVIGNVSMSGVTIRNGNVTGNGGGLLVRGPHILTLTNSIISNNTSTAGGGGILVVLDASLELVDSTVSGNTVTMAGQVGGGIFMSSNGNVNVSNLTVIRSTISGNTTTVMFSGAGIHAVGNNSTVSIVNSTISGNNGGDGIFMIGNNDSGVLDVTNSTISNNASRGIFSGILMDTLRNTIVAGNTATQCGGTIINGGNNIDSGATCGWGNMNGSMSNTNPLLGPLTLNAPGVTQTHALLPGSPAINGVTFMAPNGAPATDQRGIARPQNGGFDIGAFEFNAALPVAAGPIPTLSEWMLIVLGLLVVGSGAYFMLRRENMATG